MAFRLAWQRPPFDPALWRYLTRRALLERFDDEQAARLITLRRGLEVANELAWWGDYRAGRRLLWARSWAWARRLERGHGV